MKNIFEAETKWVAAHEKIIIVIAVLVAALYGWNMWVNKSNDKDIAANAVAQQLLQQQVTQNAALLQQMNQQSQQYQQLVGTLVAENKAKMRDMEQRSLAVQQQQKIDQTLPLSELALRWMELLKLKSEDVKNVDKGIAVSDFGARATVTTLETVPALEKDKKTLTEIVANKDTELSACNGLVKTQKEQVIPGLQKEIEAGKKACTTQLDLEKSNARKSKRNWFIRGVVSGSVATAAIVVKFLL